jgi:ABC-type sugar transport system ATPase subunit
MASENAYLQMTGISKSFHGVIALKRVNFRADLGKVTALVGENGAGKSTLIKILGGIHKRDSGDILINGKPERIDSPSAAMQCGISIIHQELNVLPNLSIAENIFVGREKKKGAFVDRKYYYKKTTELLEQVGLNLFPGTPVRYLSTAQKQMIEIVRAIAFQSKIVVMDEPTSSLTQKETQILFNMIRTLRERNISVIYISHRMEEISELADEVVVLRDGALVGSLSKEEITEDKIIKMMVGRELNEIFAKTRLKSRILCLRQRASAWVTVATSALSFMPEKYLAFQAL